MRTVRLATAEEERARNRLTASVWGNRLTEQQYLEREDALRGMEFSRAGMRTWLLEDDAQPGVTLASCETYAMTSVFDGVRGTTHGFASVFVEQRLRGRGLAGAMIDLVQKILRAEGAQAAILFSEVGASIYERAGFVARPIRGRVWTPAAGPVSYLARPLDRAAAHPGFGWQGPISPRIPRFAVTLTPAQIEWHRERSSFYRRILAPDRMDPDLLCGAEIGWTRVLWTPDYRNDVLMVLQVGEATSASASQRDAIVEVIRRAAHALGMPRAELWESPAVSLPGGESIRRDDELPMIAPYAPGLAATDWVDYGRGCWV